MVGAFFDLMILLRSTLYAKVRDVMSCNLFWVAGTDLLLPAPKCPRRLNGCSIYNTAYRSIFQADMIRYRNLGSKLLMWNIKLEMPP